MKTGLTVASERAPIFLIDGIRKFYADARKLEQYARAKVARKAGV
jgi:hypothetical protein